MARRTLTPGRRPQSRASRRLRKQVREFVGEVETWAERLQGLIDALPLPTPPEFEAMRDGRAPWTAEAYVAALAGNVHFVLDEGCLLAKSDFPDPGAALETLWARGWRPKAPLERSLRYLVQERWGEAIRPSEAEERLPFAASLIAGAKRVLTGE